MHADLFESRVFVPHPECWRVFRPRPRAIVEAGRRHVRMSKSYLNLGNVRFMREGIGGGRRPHRMHTEAGENPSVETVWSCTRSTAWIGRTVSHGENSDGRPIVYDQHLSVGIQTLRLLNLQDVEVPTDQGTFHERQTCPQIHNEIAIVQDSCWTWKTMERAAVTRYEPD